jgi:uncharacterized membrane protein YhaH (DUF805 family)
MMGPLTAVNSVFAKYFTTTGRASRAEYWWFYGLKCLLYTAAISFDIWTIWGGVNTGVEPHISFNPFDYFTTYWFLISFVPSITVRIRRLHDIGKSGFCILLVYVPLVGGTILFILTLLPSEPDTNLYGSPPNGGLRPGGRPRPMTTGASGQQRPHDPMQGYAVLDRINDKPSPEVVAARKAQVRALYEQRVLGKQAPA